MAGSLLNKGTTQPSSVQMQAFETLYPRSKYQTNLNPPADFPTILKNFAREVLREQPDNIYQFGIDYFTALKTGKKVKTSTFIEKNTIHDHDQKQLTQTTAPSSASSTSPVAAETETPKRVESPATEPQEDAAQEEFEPADSESQIDSRPLSAYEEIPEDTQEVEEDLNEEEQTEGGSVYDDSRPESAAMQDDE